MSGAVVVTGGASGIGNAIIRMLVAGGYSVVSVDMRIPQERLAERVHWVLGDVGTGETWAYVASELHARGWMSLNGIVHCAAEQVLGSASKLTSEACARTFATNVTAVILSLRELEGWLKRGSAIVNVGSVHALASTTGYALYAASKGALSALSRALAVELGPRGIRVNTVLPGAVDTPMLAAGLATCSDESDALEECAKRQVLGRIGKPVEIAQAVLFLLESERASYITGAELVVDGGGMAALSTAREGAGET